MSFLELAKKRCSCRNFNDQQVPEETLQYILEAGRVAPTGVNKQPQHILVVRSKEGLAKMKQVTKFYNAQTVLIICTEPDAAWTRQGDDFNIADIDATIVTSHMILAATEKDVASLWICRFWPEIARKEFHIPDNYRPVNILALGYTMAPSGNSPFFMRTNRSRFSSTERSRHGDGVPGTETVPRFSRICSCVWSSTYANPFLISTIAQS